MEGGQQTSLEAPLIIPNHERRNHQEGGGGGWWFIREEIWEEGKKQVGLAGPLIAVSLLQYCLQVISLMFVGHLGELPLSSASLATSFAAVSGFSVLLGMGSALETLCGQAYGAKQYHMLGIHTQRAMLSLLATAIPLSLIWFYTAPILTFFGQNPVISNEAGTFNRWMIPSLFAYALLQCLNRFLQTQSIVIPMVMISGFTALLHVLVCWVLVFGLGMGSRGAAVANGVSNWLNVILMAVYVKLSPDFLKTWTGFSREGLDDVVGFLKLAVPSAIMICLEYWSFEMVVLLSGLLPNPQLETSVLSVSLNTCWIIYMISVGLGGAISTRVSNELGAGRPQGARLALYVMVVVAIVEGAIVGTCTILVRNVWGKLYSNEEEVIRYVAKMMPLLALSDFLDGFQCVLSENKLCSLSLQTHRLKSSSNCGGLQNPSPARDRSRRYAPATIVEDGMLRTADHEIVQGLLEDVAGKTCALSSTLALTMLWQFPLLCYLLLSYILEAWDFGRESFVDFLCNL